jgi:hypothetical protein
MEISQDYVEGRADPGDSETRWACFVYEFRANGEVMFARQWIDSLADAEFLHWRDDQGRFRTFHAIPYGQHLFCDAVRHFIETRGVTHVAVLVFTKPGASPTFCSVELEELAPPR